MALKAVCFDIDGTLYPDWRARVRSLPFLLKHFRLIMAFSRTRTLMREEDLNNPDAGKAGFEPAAAAQEAAILARELGISPVRAAALRDRVFYRDWERHLRGMKIYPGVREALTRIRAAGLRTAVLSDFPVGRKLGYFGVDDLFDVRLGFPETVRLKPHPAPFRLMSSMLGVDPGDILYVGNSLEYDVYGANGAGMTGALIGPPGRRAPEGVVTYRNYRHLTECILTEVKK